jgi:hypothetical protein
MTLQEILHQAQALPVNERRELIKQLVDTLGIGTDESPRKMHSLRELRGLGKEIWEGIDAQEYINQQRDEWDQ